MTDPTNTDAQHPAIVTATGDPPPVAGAATNTDDTHPAIVTRPGELSSGSPN
jgi:hypothetical protein